MEAIKNWYSSTKNREGIQRNMDNKPKNMEGLCLVMPPVIYTVKPSKNGNN